MDIEGSSEKLRALAHPTRLRILCLLREEGRCVQDLEEKLQLRQSNVSQHLRILRDKGLVRVSRAGQKLCYSLDQELVSPILDTLENDPQCGKSREGEQE